MRFAGLVQDGSGVYPKHQGIGNSAPGNQSESMDAGKGGGRDLQPDPDTEEHGRVSARGFGIGGLLRRDRPDVLDPALKLALREPDRPRPLQQIPLDFHFQCGARPGAQGIDGEKPGLGGSRRFLGAQPTGQKRSRHQPRRTRSGDPAPWRKHVHSIRGHKPPGRPKSSEVYSRQHHTARTSPMSIYGRRRTIATGWLCRQPASPERVLSSG